MVIAMRDFTQHRRAALLCAAGWRRSDKKSEDGQLVLLPFQLCIFFGLLSASFSLNGPSSTDGTTIHKTLWIKL
jgi:hypothetical protein